VTPCTSCAARRWCLDYPLSLASGIPIRDCRFHESIPKERFPMSDRGKKLLEEEEI